MIPHWTKPIVQFTVSYDILCYGYAVYCVNKQKLLFRPIRGKTLLGIVFYIRLNIQHS